MVVYQGIPIDHTLSPWGATECLRGPQYGGGWGGGLAWPDPNLQKSRGQIPTSLAPAGASKILNFEDHSAVGKVHSWLKTWKKSKIFRLAAGYFLVVSRFAFELKIPLACLVEVTISVFKISTHFTGLAILMLKNSLQIFEAFFQDCSQWEHVRK